MPRNNRTEWSLVLINGRTGRPIDDDTGVANVLTENDPAEISIFATEDESTSSLTNPMTFRDGRIRFFTDQSVAAVDISVFTAQGHAYFLESITPSQQRIVVWPEMRGGTLVIPYTFLGASETIVHTGFNLTGNVVVKDAWLHAITLGTSMILDIGCSTDTDGFIDAGTVDSTGFKLLRETVVSDVGLGDLLTSSTTGEARALYRRTDATSGASIVYRNTTSTSTQGAGYIYLTLERIPTATA